MRMIPRLLLLASISALLTGCALLGIGRHHSARIEPQSTLPLDVEAFAQFEEGRRSLDAGNYATAINQFSLARAEPSLLAPALNGMAVAYARLGRDDLAERYFREAMAAEPFDERFAANLLRLQQERVRDGHGGAALASNDVPTPTVVTGGATPRVTVTVPRQQLVRIDAARVQLTSVVSEPSTNGAKVRLRFDQPATLARADGDTYPVRVSLPRN